MMHIYLTLINFAGLLSLVPWLSVALRMIPYCPVLNEKGTPLCALGSPTSALSGITQAQCSLECMSRGSGCVVFNYNKSSQECAIYGSQPTTFRNGSKTCSSYQVRTEVLMLNRDIYAVLVANKSFYHMIE